MVSLLGSRWIFIPSKKFSSVDFFFRRRCLPSPPSPFLLPRLFSPRTEMERGFYTFGPYKIDRSEVFYSTQLSYAMVNLRPLLPVGAAGCTCIRIYLQFGGRLQPLMVVSHYVIRREVKRFVDLTADETSDLWLTAKEVGGKLERYHEASSLTFTIQDGPQAGQTVPHVHIHILPRKKDDFERNDEIYDAIDVKERELKEKLDLDKERKDRSSEEMVREADEYRVLFL